MPRKGIKKGRNEKSITNARVMYFMLFVLHYLLFLQKLLELVVSCRTVIMSRGFVFRQISIPVDHLQARAHFSVQVWQTVEHTREHAHTHTHIAYLRPNVDALLCILNHVSWAV